MGRQPFLSVPEVKKVNGAPPWTMGLGFMAQRPALSAIIGRCLISWPQFDLQMAILLSALLESKSPAAVAVFLKLRRATNRIKSITAAAEMILDKEDLELLGAILKVAQSAEAERNALAHGYFGWTDILPDAVLWAEAEDNVRFLIDIFAIKPGTHEPKDRNEWTRLASRLYVYRERDLEDVYKQIAETINCVSMFGNYLRRLVLRGDRHPLSAHQEKARKELFDHISSRPPIQEALRALRLRAQRNK